MAQKFIILNDRQFIMGHVDMHRQLVRYAKASEIRGGGWWNLDRENKILHLFGKSEDFGQVTEDDIKIADFSYQDELKGYKVVWTPKAAWGTHNDVPLDNVIRVIGDGYGLDKVKEICGQDWYDKVVMAAVGTDEDWIIDLIRELDHIGPESQWWLEFHEKMLKAGITTKDFDLDRVYEEVVHARDLKIDELTKEEEGKYDYFTGGDDCDPAGGYGLSSHE